MKKKDLQELKAKTIKELLNLGKKTREDLARLKIDLKAGKLKNYHAYYLKKRDFARIKTTIRERQFNEKA